MQLAKWAPLSGVVFVVLWIITFVVIGEGAGDSNQEILDWYADGGNRDKATLGFLLVAIASLAMIWFAASLRQRMRAADTSMLPSLVLGAGVGAATLWIGAISAWTTIAESAGEDEFTVMPDVVRALDSFGYILWVGAGMISALLVLGTSVVALRTALLPKWLAWVGLLVAVFLLLSFTFIPFFVLLGWVLIVSLVLIWRPAEAEPATTAS